MKKVIKRLGKNFAIYKGKEIVFKSHSFDECVKKLGPTRKAKPHFSSYNPNNDVKIHLTDSKLSDIFEQTGDLND